jgi:hypothetical protein
VKPITSEGQTMEGKPTKPQFSVEKHRQGMYVVYWNRYVGI